MRFTILATCFFISGCLPWFAAIPFAKGALGTTSVGVLVDSAHLPRQGQGYRFYRGGDRRYGVPELTGAVERAAAMVAEAYPGSVLLVGDISQETGGFIGGHSSHRSGRDVDFAFYAMDMKGKPCSGHPLMRFDRFGLGVRDKEAYRFDTARNWELVEALLKDPEADVQWVFVSDGLKALLLEWALEYDRDLGIVERAASVLRQPGDSTPHNDHFHVRVLCPRKSEVARCVDTGPVWPWVAPLDEGARYTTEEIAALALEGLIAEE